MSQSTSSTMWSLVPRKESSDDKEFNNDTSNAFHSDISRLINSVRLIKACCKKKMK